MSVCRNSEAQHSTRMVYDPGSTAANQLMLQASMAGGSSSQALLISD